MHNWCTNLETKPTRRGSHTPAFSTLIKSETLNVLVFPTEEYMNPDNRRWQQEWALSQHPQWPMAGISLVPSSGICSIRTPLLQRSARTIVSFKLPLALVHSAFLASRAHQAKMSHHLVTGNWPRSAGLLLQDGRKEECVSILSNPSGHFWVLTC